MFLSATTSRMRLYFRLSMMAVVSVGVTLSMSVCGFSISADVRLLQTVNKEDMQICMWGHSTMVLVPGTGVLQKVF